MIKLNVSAANIAVEEKETLTEGRVGLLCQFRFTDEWAGLAKTAVFDGADSRDVILKGDTVSIPAECLSAEGYSLSVGVYGKNAAGDIVIPTVYATVGKIQRSVYPSGKETAEPTPDVVAQIQQAAANAETLARSVREDADLGKFIGPEGDPGGWYTPEIKQPIKGTMVVNFIPSKEGMPEVPAKGIFLPQGEAGADGKDGVDGAPGADGADGADGKSAYAYAVEGGYTGTEEEFAAKLAAEKFANPNALTFRGAVTGSYDGSEAVTVEIPSGGGSDGGGKTLTLIAELTLETEAHFSITKDSDGNPISENELIVTAYIPALSSNRDINMSVMNGSGSWVVAASYGLKTGTSATYHEHRLWATGEYLIDRHTSATSLGPAVARSANHRMVSFGGKICGIGSSYLTPPAGSVIKLYAWR